MQPSTQRRHYALLSAIGRDGEVWKARDTKWPFDKLEDFANFQPFLVFHNNLE
jgi:hypothetical protein